MADRAHVGLVDAHAEGVGGHHHPGAAGHELPLHRGALLAVQPRVVGGDLAAQVGAQQGGHLLGGRARARVDDGRPVGGVGEHGGQMTALGPLRRAAHHREGEVGPVEARRHAHRVAQAQAPLHVSGHLRGGGGRGAHDGPRAQPPRGVGQAEVVGAEVVPPLRDAVGLVDHEQAHARVAHRVEERPRREPLGRHVEQAQLAARGGGQGRAVLRARALRVDQTDPRAGHRGQALDLVLHERDQRRDDQRQVIAHQGGKLIAQRLARAGGHDDQRVAVGQGRLHRLALAGAETLEAEQAPQRPLGVGGIQRRHARCRGEEVQARLGEVRLGDDGHGRATIAPRPAAAGSLRRVVTRAAADPAGGLRQALTNGRACSKASLCCAFALSSKG